MPLAERILNVRLVTISNRLPLIQKQNRMLEGALLSALVCLA